MGRRKTASKRGVIHIHNCQSALALEREAYYGGRCDVFQMGCVPGPIFELDVNSMYPSVMRDYPYPTRLIAVIPAPSMGDLARLCVSYAVVARVHIRTGRRALPCRDSLGSRLVCGEWIACLAGPDLAPALSGGCVIRCYEAAIYDSADIFSDYVDRLWTERRKAIAARGHDAGNPYKLLLNSLYGKWGQHGTTWVKCQGIRPLANWRLWSAMEPATGEPAVYRAVGGTVEREVRAGEWLHSSPAIAAHVTSYAREKLRALILCAGLDNAYYCDTDCLHVSATGYERLRSAGQIGEGVLGMLSLVGEYPEAEYRGRKNYRLGAECTVAGANFSPADWVLKRSKIDKQYRAQHTITSGPTDGVLHQSVDLDYSACRMRGTVLPDGRVLPEVVGNAEIEVEEGAL